MVNAIKQRFLAIVLLDIVGSTAFVQKYGALKSAKWFQYHDRLTRSLCYKHQGREIDRSDGFLLSFEEIEDAINFALAYQREVPKKTKLHSRIGIHWGCVIEVQQEEKFVDAGAKRVELEGLAKNIAARTMSIAKGGQILLTKHSIDVLGHKKHAFIPREARCVCIGMYRFKGVKAAQILYAIGEDIDSLQPPAGDNKVKRLGGPKYIKKRARDRLLRDWFFWFYYRIGIAFLFYFVYLIFENEARRKFFGVDAVFNSLLWFWR